MEVSPEGDIAGCGVTLKQIWRGGQSRCEHWYMERTAFANVVCTYKQRKFELRMHWNMDFCSHLSEGKKASEPPLGRVQESQASG